MILTTEDMYVLKKEALKNIEKFQLEEALNDFNYKIDKDGNLLIPYKHKGYTCSDKKEVFEDSNVQALSFFSGAGGLDIGAQLAGVKVLSTLDFYEDSVETIKSNSFFDHSLHLNKDINDVKGIDFSDIIKKNNPSKLILLGGPPCQPFSKAGYWVTNKKRKSYDDPRNMIEQYFRMISEIKPDGFVLENVESIVHPSNKHAVENIIDHIESLGYKYTILRLNSADYGIPQKRKRVFFLATKKDIKAELEITHCDIKKTKDNPDLLPYERVIDWIGKFDDPVYIDEKYVNTSGKWGEELTWVPPGKNYIALSEKAGHPKPTFVAGKRYWSSLLKLHPGLPSWTIIASPGHWEGPFHWNNRRLNIREAAALQTFPDDYLFSGSLRSQRMQIGNAVPPLLAKIIIEELRRWL